MTGATGGLGRNLLDALIRDPTVDKIQCIAIRDVTSHDDMAALNKVRLHEGDLRKVRLGLSDSAAASIFSGLQARL
jgi:hybrid polyketide synthase/nonribosomal peptide synthetase ACE1